MVQTPTSETLLAAAVDHVAEHGIGDFSLRKLAGELGTSHRMLIYHFGSREGLLVRIVRTVEARQRASFAELTAEPGSTPEEAARTFWRAISDPATHAQGRLFFELSGRALHGYPGTEGLLDGYVDMWLEPFAEFFGRFGFPAEHRRPLARLAVAVGRGLLLDLLATGDRAGVDAAIEAFTVLLTNAAVSASGGA